MISNNPPLNNSIKNRYKDLQLLEQLHNYNITQIIQPLQEYTNDVIQFHDNICMQSINKLMNRMSEKVQKMSIMVLMIKKNINQKKKKNNSNTVNNGEYWKSQLIQDSKLYRKIKGELKFLNNNSVKHHKNNKVYMKQQQQSQKQQPQLQVQMQLETNQHEKHIQQQQSDNKNLEPQYFCHCLRDNNKSHNYFHSYQQSLLHHIKYHSKVRIRSIVEKSSHLMTKMKNLLPLDPDLIVVNDQAHKRKKKMTIKSNDKQDEMQIQHAKDQQIMSNNKNQNQIKQQISPIKTHKRKYNKIKSQFNQFSMMTRSKKLSYEPINKITHQEQYAEQQEYIYKCGICPNIKRNAYSKYVLHLRKHDFMLNKQFSHLVIRNKKGSEPMSIIPTDSSEQNKLYECSCEIGKKYKREIFVEHVLKWHAGITPKIK